MIPDFDLSNLAEYQADLWLYLHSDAIRAQISSIEPQARNPVTLSNGPPPEIGPQTRIPIPSALVHRKWSREN